MAHDQLGNLIWQLFVACVGLGILFNLSAIRRNGLKIIEIDDDDPPRGLDDTIPTLPPTPGIERQPDEPPTVRVVERPVPELRRRASDRIDGAWMGRTTREQVAQDRDERGMLPATFHYSDPPEWMLNHPLFQTIWDEIKTWDVNVPTEYGGYCGATGNHVAAIVLAIMDRYNFDGFDWEGAKMRIIQDRRRP